MSGLRVYALGFVGFLRYGLLSWFVEPLRLGCAVTTPSAEGLRVVGLRVRVITGGSAENTQAIANPGWDGGNEVARMRIFAGTNRGGCGRHGRIRKGVRIDFVSR